MNRFKKSNGKEALSGDSRVKNRSDEVNNASEKLKQISF
jgi:hypothetical protein